MLVGTRISLRIVPSPGRLHEWIAIEDGLFPLERVSPELLDFVMHRASDQDALPFRARPQDEPLVRNQAVVNSAAIYSAIYYASTGLGRIVPDLYGVSRLGLYVRPDSLIREVEDLAHLPIGVGLLSGSHFATLQLLEERLPRGAIVVENAGGQRHRLNALLGREIEAAALTYPAAALADHHGLRRLATVDFKRLFWVHKDLDPYALAAYFRVLRRAEAALAADPDRYRDLWARALPTDLAVAGGFDYETFGLGERLVFEPFPRSEFEAIVRWLDSWQIEPPLHERTLDKLIVRVPI